MPLSDVERTIRGSDRPDPPSNELLLFQFPEYFTWTGHSWKRRRKQLDTIGRMFTVSPRAGDLVYLRLLLTRVRGPRNWNHLRIVNGYVCVTFQVNATCNGV